MMCIFFISVSNQVTTLIFKNQASCWTTTKSSVDHSDENKVGYSSYVSTVGSDL